MSQTKKIQEAGLSEERGAEAVKAGDHVAWKWGQGEAALACGTCVHPPGL